MIRIFTVVHTDVLGADVLYATKDPEHVVEVLNNLCRDKRHYERSGHNRATVYTSQLSMFDRYLVRSHTHPGDRCNYPMNEPITNRRERPDT